VQFDVRALLNIRVVTTFTGGKVVTFDQGVDGWDGEATFAAATAMKNNNGHCMNNDGRYPATASHPDIVLNYADTADANSYQARKLQLAEPFELSVPSGRYSWLGFYFMSSSGASSVYFKLLYEDNTSTIFTGKIPDWYPGDLDGKPAYLFLVASDLAKWDLNNTRPEPDKHSLYGVSVPVDPSKVLKGMILKQSGGGYCTLWGGSGTRESPSAVSPRAAVSGISMVRAGRRAVDLRWPAGEGRWRLTTLEGRIVSEGRDARGEVRVDLPGAGVYLLVATTPGVREAFRLVAD